MPTNDIAILTYQFRYREKNGEWNPRYYGSWVHVPERAGNDRSYTVGNFGALTNGKKHTFEVRAWNHAGGGTPARTTSTPTSGNDPVPPVTPKLNINGGYGVEGVDANIGFAISLAPAASETVTVDYVNPEPGIDRGRQSPGRDRLQGSQSEQPPSRQESSTSTSTYRSSTTTTRTAARAS